ncbi:MAG: hypothetical protein J6W03_01330 [Bacteroidaceae bacterium]|nr:hypothetical protein [Bacteroidaceae bacterium]
MKRIILTFSFLLVGIAMIAQQPQRRKFNPQEFKAKLESYVTQEAGFNQNEAAAFYPIYFEMKGKQRGLQRQIFQLKRNAPTTEVNDQEFAIIIQKIKDLGVEMAQLEVTYYKKMCKVVSPAKVYKAMCAEDKFHREMLENFDRGRNRGPGNRSK